MKRRHFIGAGIASLALARGHALAGLPDGSYLAPPRFSRPMADSDEGGLWAMMDREERQLRRSPFVIHDLALKNYVQDIACRLTKDHCPDIRIHIVRTPLFNASMAPNGMMQVWTGLLLRVENEAQLAAILGHEIGHFLQRHTMEKLKDIKAKSAFAQFIGVLGVVGAVGQMALVAGAFAFDRESEREADLIGAYLMHSAGYDVAEAARVWENLETEIKAKEGGENRAILFATHPPPPERRATLEKMAAKLGKGRSDEERYLDATEPFLSGWLEDEVKRGQHEESLALLDRNVKRGRQSGRMHYYRGEVYRLRNGKGDLEAAMADYRQAVAQKDGPPAAWRGLGLILRQQGKNDEARQSLGRYLELVPDAPDAPLLKTYLNESLS